MTMMRDEDLPRWEWWLLAVTASVATFGVFALYAGLFWLLNRLAAAERRRYPLTYRQRRRLGLVPPSARG